MTVKTFYFRFETLSNKFYYANGCSPNKTSKTTNAGVFCLEIVIEALPAAFFAKAGFLQPAKRNLWGHDQHLVDSDQPVLQLVLKPERPSKIAGISVGREAVFRIIGHADRIVFRVEPIDRGDRTKDLFPCDPHGLVCLGDDSRLEEQTAARMAVSARAHDTAIGDRIGNQLLGLFDRRHVDHRTLLCPVIRPGRYLESGGAL